MASGARDGHFQTADLNHHNDSVAEFNFRNLGLHLQKNKLNYLSFIPFYFSHLYHSKKRLLTDEPKKLS
jgi:hypothetical protein